MPIVFHYQVRTLLIRESCRDQSSTRLVFRDPIQPDRSRIPIEIRIVFLMLRSTHDSVVPTQKTTSFLQNDK